MHPSRRRKKRPNYGIRTVEVARGPNGFGFTISGQQPCILSCIVSNSPADQAGLRAGDFLISVNGMSVSKITHDAVVNLIGSSFGPIKMTIAENYYSDSSDEDVTFGRAMNTRKPKYPHKPRIYRGYKQDPHKKFAKAKEYVANECYEEAVCAPNVNAMEEEGGPIEYKAIVGYLGTIEMPKQLLPNSRLQTVCGCIKKLRQEKRKPTAILMTVLPTCLTLKNASNHILAIYPTNRVVYISSALDKESRYFGLVTSAVCDNAQRNCEMAWDGVKKPNIPEHEEIEVSNSCHVFMTDPKIVEHSVHATKAESFQILCTNDPITGSCLEFPRNALYIVSLVQNMYRLQSTVEPNRVIEDLVANSPQPSASSNSDSGIGFRDDCGNISDRILLVEFPIGNRQPTIMHNNNNNNRPSNIAASMVPLEVLDLPLSSFDKEEDFNELRPNLNNIRAFDKSPAETDYQANRLTCRAYGDLELGADYSERAIDVPEPKDFKRSMDNVSMHSVESKTPFKVPFVEKKRRVKRNLVASCDSLVQSGDCDTMLSYKLSPKVYGVSKPNYSCEELSKLDATAAEEKCGGSLQNFAFMWGGQKHRGITQSEPDVRIGGVNTCENNGASKFSGEGPASWATSFEKLLECPTGLHTFAEFLKKEFSAENIYFWTACERYRKLTSHGERATEAQRIYQAHIRIGAPEGVNVDSQARQCVEQALKNVPINLFASAQKHIFNLMKFDSYSRFLKTDLYKQCLAGHSDVQQFDPNLLLQPVSPNKLKKSLSNAEDRRRKSLLPWHRKNRSKSKDRGEAEFHDNRHDINENITETVQQQRNEVHSSRSSLTSLDLAINTINDPTKPNSEQLSNSARPPLCRVKLVNGSTTVTQIKPTETIAQLVNRLLEKRGITYSCFEVYTDKQNKPLNISESSGLLAGCEVDVEQRISFRLDLPNKKVIAVKSKCSKLLVEVLRPILNKYSYNLEDVAIRHQGEDVIIDRPVTTVDTLKLSVQLLPTSSETVVDANYLQRSAKPPSPTLDEITNKVYEDILQEKSAETCNSKAKSDRESVKSEDWGSENSSGLIGRFLKRDSERNRDRKKKLLSRKGNSTHSSVEDVSSEHAQGAVSFKKPLIAKLKAGVKLQNTSESEELYEGLSRAQRSRLEDQRGTEINFELPDFLKNKENEQSRQKAKNLAEMAKFYTETKPDRMKHLNYENRTLLTEYNQHAANNNSRLHNYNVYSPNKSPPGGSGETVTENAGGEGSPKTEPPPLPPKPKILPIKPSNWKQRENPRTELYLEQPTSSFV